MYLYIVFFAIFFIILLSIAKVAQRFLSNFSLGLVFIGLLSIFLSLLFVLDFIQVLNRFVSLGLFLAIFLVAIGLQVNKKTRLLKADLIDLFWNSITIVASILFIAIPLIVLFPPQTSITGHFVSNDSVIHAILSKGFEYTRSVNLPEMYNLGYPRGIHSFIYSVSMLFGEETYQLLLPVIISFFGLTSLIVFELVKRLKINKLTILAIGIFSVSAFLPLITGYTLFLAQIVVIPFLLMFVLNTSKFKRQFLGSFLILAILVCIFNIYGIFSLSLALFVLFAEKIFIFFQNYHHQRRINLHKLKLKKRVVIGIFLAGIFFLTLSFPSILINTQTLLRQSTTEVGSDFTKSFGNLPNGFLSSFHLTGSWPGSLSYRDSLSGENSNFEYLLLVLMVFQLIVIVKANIDKSVILKLTLLTIPILASAFIVKNQYLQFKYLTFVIPLFMAVLGVSLFLIMSKSRLKLLPLSIILMYIFVNFAFYLGSFRFTPSLREFQLEEISQVYNTYTEEGSTLFLTKEDWFQYFIDKKDVYAPMTLYIPRYYSSEDLDYIIWDIAYDKENMEYVNSNVRLSNDISKITEKCIEYKFARYKVLKLNCN